MTKIDIFSGFLGAGKTTLIKKLIQEAYKGEKLVLIENEFGEIGIDGGFLKDSGVEITEMNSGCICCSLVGDFGQALEQVLFQFKPDRVIIEPSGVGKLSDVIGAVQRIDNKDVELNAFVTVADASKCKIYMKNFGEFFNNQIEHAATIVLSRTAGISEKKLLDAVNLIREHNADAPVITTPWDELDGAVILNTMENKNTLKEELAKLAAQQAAHDEEHEHHHHHDHDEHEHHHHDHDEHEHHHDHDEHEHHHDHDEHEHHHDHDEHEHHHDHDEHEHHHDHDEHEHHHDHDEHEHHHDDDGHEHHHDHHEHEHHHHDDDVCTCGHDHDHCTCGHDHHHADEIFGSWGMETPRKYTEEEISSILSELDNEEKYGIVLRAKGIVPAADGAWIHFDYVPGEKNIRRGAADITGRLCVIGSELKEDILPALFLL